MATKQFTKTEFINHLNELQTNGGVILKIKQLPEVLSNKNNYELNIVVTFMDDNNSTYALNYYSRTNIEFLFPYKIKNDLKTAVDELFDEVTSFLNKPFSKVIK